MACTTAELVSECGLFSGQTQCGVQGGGMDQAVSLMAQPGVAMHVEFNPVRYATAGPVQLSLALQQSYTCCAHCC
jgi:galactokinase